ncbi:fungal-specific transcription factor domain-containing protein [Aspergillus unguis]
MTPWLQFTGQQTKRKRAELACTVCHGKKVRCDLQTRTREGQSNCTNCESAGKECRMRPSRRNLRRTRNRSPLTPPASSQGRPQGEAQAHAQPTEQNGLETADEQEWLWNFPSTLPETGAATGTGTGTTAGEQPSPIQDDSPETVRTEETDRGLSSRYYELEIQADARNQEQRLLAQRPPQVRLLPGCALQQSFVETYHEYCYPWCPVFDQDQLSLDSLAQSPLLVNALAVVGSHVRPPALPHDGPAAYYERARNLFYNDAEPDVVRALQAISLFYWWSPRPPSILHRHSSWWWTSVVIRHCQQLGVHQQPSLGPGPASSQHNHPTNHRSHLIRRRIWWTAFARERLTAICQGKPCTIDPEDCDIAEPTLDDFPDAAMNSEARVKAEIFIYWVRLCAIIGRIAKYLNRPRTSAGAFPTHLARELIAWVHSLPPHLTLPIDKPQTSSFKRDIHQLHLPYLAVIIMLHLKQPSQHQPEAYPPAILAASCMARIFRDTLARGSTHWLMAITGWYTSMAFIALLQAVRVDGLTGPGNEDLDVLVLAVDQLRKMWPTANIFHEGFQRLRPALGSPDHGIEPVSSFNGPVPSLNDGAGAEALLSLSNSEPMPPPGPARPPVPRDENAIGGIDWMEYFPFASPQTSGVAERLLVPHTNMDELFFDNLDVFPDSMVQFQDLVTDFTSSFAEVDLFM